MLIYIVARPFVSLSKGYLPGDIIVSPEDIRLFRTKISEGKIIRMDRKAPDTIQRLKFYSKKFNRPTLLKDVKAYIKSVEGNEEESKKEVKEVKV